MMKINYTALKLTENHISRAQDIVYMYILQIYKYTTYILQIYICRQQKTDQ